MVDAMIGTDMLRAQYGSPDNLAARQSLWQYRDGPPLVDLVLDRVPLGAVVADVGCGNGMYLERLRRRGGNPRTIGLDRSEGMARTAAKHARTVAADAQALPLRRASVDVALSLHMLYHVPDIGQAVAELRRVVRPGGRVLVATNGAGHTAELKAILADAARWVAGIEVNRDWDTSRFDTEIALAMLREVFDRVDVVPAGGPVQVPDPTIVMEYVASWPRDAAEPATDPMWTAIQAEVTRAVLAHFATESTLTVTSAAAVLVAHA